METIIIALKEELIEAKKLVKKYADELAKLPKGTFFIRKLGQNQYGYITRSERGQIKQEYLGLIKDDELASVKEKFKRQKKLKALLKQTKIQLAFLQKALRHANKES